MDSLFTESFDDGLKLDYMVAYSQLLINEQFDDRRYMISILDESTMLLEGGELISLNEGFILTVVNFIKRITQAIANVIDKFVSNMRKFIKVDAKFLSDNETRIKQGPNIDNKDTLTNVKGYQRAIEAIKNGGNFTFRKVDYGAIEQNADNWQSIVDYVNNAHLAGLSNYSKDEQVTLKNRIINNMVDDPRDLRCNEVTRDRRAFMFDFCNKDCKEIINSIEKNKDILKEVNNSISNKLEQFKKEETNNTQANAKIDAEVRTQQVNPPTQQPTNASTLEDTLDLYFHEDGMKIQKGDNGGNAENATEGEKEPDKWQKMANAIKSYYNANSQMLSAQMTIVNDAYRQYMKTLRWYVSNSKWKSGGDKNAPKVDEKDKAARI